MNKIQILYDSSSNESNDEIEINYDKLLYKVYSINKYAMKKEKFVDFLKNGCEQYSIEDLVNNLNVNNKGYHIRIHIDQTYIFFGDIDEFKHPISMFLKDIQMFLKKYYNIVIFIADVKYSQNYSKEGSYHYSIPKIHCSCNKLKEMHLKFKRLYAKNYKYIKNDAQYDCIDTTIYCEKWFRLPLQSKESVKNTEHKIIIGEMKDFIVEYIPEYSVNIEKIKFVEKIPITKQITDVCKMEDKFDYVSISEIDTQTAINVEKIDNRDKNSGKKSVGSSNKNIMDELEKTSKCAFYLKYKELFDKCYKQKRFDTYEYWIVIGMALKNIYGMDAYTLFDYFSSKSKKYEGRDVTLRKYESFKTNYDKGYTMSIIYKYAEEDNKKKYNEIMSLTVTFLENDFAKKIYELAGDKFIYKQMGPNGNYKLYCYNGKYWNMGSLYLEKYISAQLYDYYDNLYNTIYSSHPQAKKIKNQFNGLKLSITKNHIIKQYVEFGDKKLDFDEKWWLFGFDNKVLDLKTHTFRDYQPDDYITITTFYDWVEPTEEEINTVENIIKQIMPVESERELYKQILATGLEGRNLEKFIVFNGFGRNGKGLTDEFVIFALGNYAMFANNSILFETAKTGSNPELANLDKKRFIVFKEPPSKKKFENSIIKELSGGGKISARSHHETQTEKTLHSTAICECNIKPRLAEEPQVADVERIIDVPFRSTFTTNEEDLDELNNIYKVDISLKSNEFRHKHKCALIHILIEAHKRYAANNFILSIPESVKQRTADYLEQSCNLLGWFKEKYIFTNNKEDILDIKKVYDNFKEGDYWMTLNYVEKRKHNYAYFTDYFYRNIITGKHYKVDYIKLIDTQRKHYRNVMLGWKEIEEENVKENMFYEDES